jgi:hypothetical protein
MATLQSIFTTRSPTPQHRQAGHPAAADCQTDGFQYRDSSIVGWRVRRKHAISSAQKRLLFLLLTLHDAGHDLDPPLAAARSLEREYLALEDEDE